MHNTFRSFQALLAKPEPPPIAERSEPASCACSEEALRDLRFFNARVRQGVDDAVQTLLHDIAATVLARELELRPCDIERIVERACSHFASDKPLCVRVHPVDAPLLAQSAVAVVKDAQLRRGDAILELSTGHIDASLGARLASILPALAS